MMDKKKGPPSEEEVRKMYWANIEKKREKRAQTVWKAGKTSSKEKLLIGVAIGLLILLLGLLRLKFG